MDKMPIMAMLAGIAFGGPAFASENYYVCSFEALPSLVLHYPEQSDPTLRLGSRPPVGFLEGSGSGRIISAEVDGYDVRFTPSNSVLDIAKEENLLASEIGRCVSTLQLEVETPLVFEEPQDDAPQVLDTGEWRVSTDTSAFDDTTSVYLNLEASSRTLTGSAMLNGPPCTFDAKRIQPYFLSLLAAFFFRTFRDMDAWTSGLISTRPGHKA
ncbi:hypothetical protein [Mesobacterium pallidum]|uniref:hypothetical protein n=1 Tax=Mesobacterium pallidum TaxID=2872037 RepID=UPI001EE2EBA4